MNKRRINVLQIVFLYQSCREFPLLSYRISATFSPKAPGNQDFYQFPGIPTTAHPTARFPRPKSVRNPVPPYYLPQELALSDITDTASANRYLAEACLPRFNAQFAVLARESGSAFVAWVGGELDDILCGQFGRKAGNDNGVRFEKLFLQIPGDQYRCNYVKARVRVHRYLDGALAIFRGARRLASYTPEGRLLDALRQAA